MSIPTRTPTQLDGRSSGHPMFSTQTARVHPAHSSRSPDIYMLGPDEPAFTLAELIAMLASPSMDDDPDSDSSEAQP